MRRKLDAVFHTGLHTCFIAFYTLRTPATTFFILGVQGVHQARTEKTHHRLSNDVDLSYYSFSSLVQWLNDPVYLSRNYFHMRYVMGDDACLIYDSPPSLSRR